MSARALDELGPVDYVVVEFPAGASTFTGEMAAELLRLVDAGTIRVIDVLILTKDADGKVEATEFSDIDELGELQALRKRASAPTPPGQRRCTTTRCRTSPASSAPWSWCRRAWSTPGNGARAGNRPSTSGLVTAR